MMMMWREHFQSRGTIQQTVDSRQRVWEMKKKNKKFILFLQSNTSIILSLYLKNCLVILISLLYFFVCLFWWTSVFSLAISTHLNRRGGRGIGSLAWLPKWVGGWTINFQTPETFPDRSPQREKKWNILVVESERRKSYRDLVWLLLRITCLCDLYCIFFSCEFIFFF